MFLRKERQRKCIETRNVLSLPHPSTDGTDSVNSTTNSPVQRKRPAAHRSLSLSSLLLSLFLRLLLPFSSSCTALLRSFTQRTDGRRRRRGGVSGWQQVARGSSAGQARDANQRKDAARAVSATPSARERKGNWAQSVVSRRLFLLLPFLLLTSPPSDTMSCPERTDWLTESRVSVQSTPVSPTVYLMSGSFPRLDSYPRFIRSVHSAVLCFSGTDGRTYRHVCRLTKKKCTTADPLLSVAYRGQCKGELSLSFLSPGLLNAQLTTGEREEAGHQKSDPRPNVSCD